MGGWVDSYRLGVGVLFIFCIFYFLISRVLGIWQRMFGQPEKEEEKADVHYKEKEERNIGDDDRVFCQEIITELKDKEIPKDEIGD